MISSLSHTRAAIYEETLQLNQPKELLTLKASEKEVAINNTFSPSMVLLQIKHHPTPKRTTAHLSLLSFFYIYRYSSNVKEQMFLEACDSHADDEPQKAKKSSEKHTQNKTWKESILPCRHICF